MLLNADTFCKNKYMILYISYELIYQFSGYAIFIFFFFCNFENLNKVKLKCISFIHLAIKQLIINQNYIKMFLII